MYQIQSFVHWLNVITCLSVYSTPGDTKKLNVLSSIPPPPLQSHHTRILFSCLKTGKNTHLEKVSLQEKNNGNRTTFTYNSQVGKFFTHITALLWLNYEKKIITTIINTFKYNLIIFVIIIVITVNLHRSLAQSFAQVRFLISIYIQNWKFKHTTQASMKKGTLNCWRSGE